MITLINRKRALAFVALVTSLPAFAANRDIQWELFLLGITVISMLGAIWITGRNKDYETRAMRVLAAGVYFWAFTFLQFIVLALIYTVM